MTPQEMKTINIKGKEYVTVNERIKFFNENYKSGSIRTELVSDVASENIVIKASVYPDTKNMEQYFTGYSQATVGMGYINKTSALENAETSAVGRALGMMGIGITESVASAEEVQKAVTQSEEVPPDPTDDWASEADAENKHFCELHKKDLKDRGKGVWDHRAKLDENKQYSESGNWYFCQGKGWHLSLIGS